MRKQIALGTVMAVGLAGPALAAEGFSYNNVEAGYFQGEIEGVLDGGEGFSSDGGGFTLSGSAELGEMFHAFASFSSLSLKDFEVDGVGVDVDGKVKVEPLTLGVGLHWPLSPSLDLVSGVSFERMKLTLSEPGFSVSDSESGYGISAGLRGRVGENLELTGNVKYLDIGGSEMVFGAGARYYFTPAFAAGLDFTKYDDTDLTLFGLSVRYDFGG